MNGAAESPANKSGVDKSTVDKHMRVAPVLYGGTFDPIHDGHLAVARAVATAAEQPVQLMPAALPPHRATPGASDAHRLAMLQRAIANEPNLRVDDRELRRQGASYTVLTVRECAAQGQLPALVLGWDAFCGFPGWREPEVLLQQAVLIVLPRAASQATAPSEALPALLQARWARRQQLTAQALQQAEPGDVLFCVMPEHPASATAIRAALRAGQQQPDGLPAAVAAYIREHHLYAS